MKYGEKLKEKKESELGRYDPAGEELQQFNHSNYEITFYRV